MQQIESLNQHQQSNMNQMNNMMNGQTMPSYNIGQVMPAMQPQYAFQNQMMHSIPMHPQQPPLVNRRNQQAAPQQAMIGGPPTAPSTGIAGGPFGSFEFPQQPQGRENAGGSRGRGDRGDARGGHQRRHSLALPEAVKAAEVAQQKRTTNNFQFPAAPAPEDESASAGIGPTDPAPNQSVPARAGRAGHGRSQSMAVGSNGRGGASGRGGSHLSAEAPGFDSTRRNSHQRAGSRAFESNWRTTQSQPQDQVGQNGGVFQPGHRSRNSMSHQSLGSVGGFQYPPQMIQMPSQIPSQMAPQMMMPSFLPGHQLNAAQIQHIQALQQQQMGGQSYMVPGNQHAGHGQQPQGQQRKTLFTPYLPQASLPALLGEGQLVSGILRVNKKNRSDAYVSTQDGVLDADIFICGSKDRNRALEGDLVAIELLDVDEVWSQKREKEEKKKRKDITDTRSGSTNGGNQSNQNADDNNGTDGGLRRRGSLRQRPTQKKNDDVEVEGQSLLLVEEEEINDEQKPLYAGHVVAVIERVAGQMFSGNLGLLRPSSQATKEKQEAERAARDGGRQHDNRQPDKPKIVWFKPTDKRVPLIAIPTEQAPKEFVEKHQDFADRIFVSCIKRWPITSLHPFGTLVEQLGKMGELSVETDALLRDNNFSNDTFSDAVIRSLTLDEWSLSDENEAAISARRDFRDEKTFTLDMDGSPQLSNALHVKTLSDGKVEIGVHVPDVAHFVKSNSLVDREAKKRGTAVHLVNKMCALLPPVLFAKVCSLMPGEERLTVSVVFKVNQETGVVAEGDTWIGKGIVNSGGKLSLSEIDDALSRGSGFQHSAVDARDLLILNVSV